MNIERATIVWSGTVQGVGFRWRAVQASRGLQVTGYVKNLPDGRVEMVAEGERSEIERFAAAVRAEMGGLIEGAEVSWSAASGEFRAFEVRR